MSPLLRFSGSEITCAAGLGQIALKGMRSECKAEKFLMLQFLTSDLCSDDFIHKIVHTG